MDRLTYSAAKDWIKVSLPIAHVERLLDTKYSVYKYEDGTHIARAPTWSLPTHLHKHIDTIQPTNSFFRAAPRKSNVMPVEDVGKDVSEAQRVNTVNPPADITVAQACNVSAVTPLCLRTLYGTINYSPKVPGKNKVGLTNYLNEANNRSDVFLFLQQFRPEAAQAAFDFTVEVINNGDNQQTPDNATQLEEGKDLEGNLDAETILGIDYPTPLIAYNTGGSLRSSQMTIPQPTLTNPTSPGSSTSLPSRISHKSSVHPMVTTSRPSPNPTPAPCAINSPSWASEAFPYSSQVATTAWDLMAPASPMMARILPHSSPHSQTAAHLSPP